MSRKQETKGSSADLSPLDERGLLERVDGNRELLREVVELFLDSYPRQREELRAAVERADAAEIARVAHAIKGSVGFFAVGPAIDLARRLETMGRRAELSEAEETRLALDATMERLTAALAAFVGLGSE